MEKLLWLLINFGITKMLKNEGGCLIEEVSITAKNELTIFNQDGSIYKVKIESQLEI